MCYLESKTKKTNFVNKQDILLKTERDLFPTGERFTWFIPAIFKIKRETRDFVGGEGAFLEHG